MKKSSVKIQESQQFDSKTKKNDDQYKCGNDTCGKVYHSYTAFYNHCKKQHGGQFPSNSLLNDKLFQGPQQNRGRPRIKKNQAKDHNQIQSMKKQNQLIQFMGTLKTKKSDQLIVYVQNPVQRVQAAVIQVKQWIRARSKGQLKKQDNDYLNYVQQFNRIIDKNDLPQFYDPIQTNKYPDKLDSYSFSSVYNFMIRTDMRQNFNIKLQGKQLLFKIYLCWSARILSQKLFNEVLYIIMNIEKPSENINDYLDFQQRYIQLLCDKKKNLNKLISDFFQYFLKEHQKDQQKDGKRSNHFNQRRFAEDADQEDQDQDQDQDQD